MKLKRVNYTELIYGNFHEHIFWEYGLNGILFIRKRSLNILLIYNR